ncbi:protein CANDIDATE G-PROTEIN COUPLED RECEPTOR 7-like [Typha latifolia]|uniref:protein CANDIDATE G-PROTEIN COUPLED RECEPTOR 7-like n=1 Tax=Typha latifolia TaxID=4733 RepID=UPI003C2BFBF3
MGHFHKHLLLLLLLLLINGLLPIAHSEIKKTRIESDPRPIILFEQFGYTHSGHVVVSVKGVSWKPPPRVQLSEIDPRLMGFFLIAAEMYPSVANESTHADERFCPLESRFVERVLVMEELEVDSSCTREVVVERDDEYSLFFGSCQPGVEVSMDVRTEMYNVDASGKRDYLPTGRAIMPQLYFFFFVAYLAFLFAWLYLCVKHRATVDKIHGVMAALLLFKALKMVCAAEDTWYVERTGTPHGWDVAFYVFGFFKGVLLFTVIVLIGTGWSFIKPYLQEREKNVLMIVIPMQVIENIASAVIGETGPAERDWLTWNQIFLLVDVVCCCAVFFPIIWSIRNLREASKTDGKAARNLQKLTLFKKFYMVVVGYLYFTRIVASALGAQLSYRLQWVVTAAVEAASLAFYMFVFYNFQPVEKNPYLYIGEEAAARVLEMEDIFEL